MRRFWFPLACAASVFLTPAAQSATISAVCGTYLATAANFLFGYDWAVGAPKFRPIAVPELVLNEPDLRLQWFFASGKSPATLVLPNYAEWDLSSFDDAHDAAYRAVAKAIAGDLTAKNRDRLAHMDFNWAFDANRERHTSWLPAGHHEQREPVKYYVTDKYASTLLKQVHSGLWMIDVPKVPALNRDDPRMEGRVLGLFEVGTPATALYVYVHDNRYLRMLSLEEDSTKRFEAVAREVGAPLSRSFETMVGNPPERSPQPFTVAAGFAALMGMRYHVNRSQLPRFGKDIFDGEERRARYFAIRDYFGKHLADGSGFSQKISRLIDRPNAEHYITSINDLVRLITATSGRVTSKKAMLLQLDRTFAKTTGSLDYALASSFVLDQDFTVTVRSAPFPLDYRIDPDGTVTLTVRGRPDYYRVQVAPRSTARTTDAQVKGLVGHAAQVLLRFLRS